MNNRPKWDGTFSDILDVFAKRSTCLKYKTAAMIVSGSQIISFGYNGTFSRCTECDAYWLNYYRNTYVAKTSVTSTFEEWIRTEEFRTLHREWSKNHEIHAEVNALNWISKRNIDDTYILYTTYSPCDACAKAIISYGIKTIKYKHKYPNGEAALVRLIGQGVKCIQI